MKSYWKSVEDWFWIAAVVTVTAGPPTLALAAPGDAATPSVATDVAVLPVLGDPLGCNGSIHVMKVDGPRILLGGDFSVCGDQPARGVVAYDPLRNRYAAFGEGVEGTVLAIEAVDAELIIGGRFSLSEGQPATNVARWTGDRWQALGEGVDGEVRALALWQEQIYAGGAFASAGGAGPHLARWDGQQWWGLSGAQASGVDDAVEDLLADGERLLVAGRFTRAGDARGELVAAWDGSAWTDVGLGFAPSAFNNGPQVAHQWLRDGERLFVVGQFGLNADLSARGSIQQLVDGRWQRFGLPYAYAMTSATLAGGKLWVTGRDAVTHAESDQLSYPGGSVLALASWANQVYVAGGRIGLGALYAAPRTAFGTLSRFDPEDRIPVALGLPRVNGELLTSLDDGDSILLGGHFENTGVLRWNGSSLQPLGQMDPSVRIRALTRFQGAIHAGGQWRPEGAALSVPYLARWDGQQWIMLEPSLSTGSLPEAGFVQVLHPYGGDLWVGGAFNVAGSVFSGGVMRWDGQRWLRLGDGGPATRVGIALAHICSACQRTPEIHTITEYRGQLILGGFFNAISGEELPPGTSPFIAPVVVWNGERLAPLSRTDPRVAALPPVYFATAHADELLLAASAGNTSCQSVLAWNGQTSRWLLDAQGPTFDPTIQCLRNPSQLLSLGNRLYLTGRVLDHAGDSKGGLVQWDGRRLSAVPLPPQSMPTALLAQAGGRLLYGDLPYAGFAPPERASERDQAPGNAASDGPALDRLGRRLAFASAASNLGQLHDGQAARIHLRDLPSGRMQPVSDLVALAGLSSVATGFAHPSLSADGQLLAFEGTDGQVYGLRANRPMRISIGVDGSSAVGQNRDAAVAPAGRFVAYAATQAGATGSGDGSAIVLRDLVGASSEPISVAGGSDHRGPALADAGVVAFSAIVDGQRQIHVSRPAAGGRELLLVSATDGQPGNGDSMAVRLSANGRFGVFHSAASNLVPGDDNGVDDVYWFALDDVGVAELRRVSLDSLGGQANGHSRFPVISDDGQLLAFQSAANNLVELDHNNFDEVFLHFLATGETRRYAGSGDGLPPAAGSRAPTLSADGTQLAFVTEAGNLGGAASAQVVRAAIARPRRSDGLAAGPLPQLAAGPLPLPLAPMACPGGYHTALVDDGDGAGLQPGHWGLEILLSEPGLRELAGGLNFGGLVDALQPAFAAFNIANATGEPQRLDIELAGLGMGQSQQSLDVQLLLRRPDGTRQVLAEQLSLTLQQPWRYEIDLLPGYYTLELHARDDERGGAAAGEFLLSASTRYLDRPGGGFQGGVVVGGYHGEPLAMGLSGFAGFCAPKPESVSARLVYLAQNGKQAEDLRLRIEDAERVGEYEVDSR